jgi:hypothetical protein
VWQKHIDNLRRVAWSQRQGFGVAQAGCQLEASLALLGLACIFDVRFVLVPGAAILDATFDTKSPRRASRLPSTSSSHIAIANNNHKH